MKSLASRFYLFALLAALLAAGILSLGLGGGFVLDDAHTIVNNSLVQVEVLDRDSLLYAASSFHAGGSLRPLAMSSFALDYWRHGSLDADTFKFTNIFIHALTTFALAIFFRQLFNLAKWEPRHAAVFALVLALLWAIHPLQVSSVLYVVQRMQTMATLFLILAMWAYIRLRQAQIEGGRAWPHGVLVAVFWLLALASKEDAALLPAYCLLLELILLRFAASQRWREHSLRRAYLIMGVAAAGCYFFWVLPHYWAVDAYGGREFNSVERLLTQARVLVMYLGQIMLPLPSMMPFNYDSILISEGLLKPATTLPALLLLLALIAWAWCWRVRRPIFSFGVLLFFAGHFVSSNVIPLELAFEHRNHFPLIGIVLALGDLLFAAWQHFKLRSAWVIATTITLLVAIAACGGIRAYIWSDPIRLAKYNVRAAPESSRAWLTLGGAYFDLAGRRAGKDSPYLVLAIETVEEAAEKTGSPSAFSNIVIYRTIQGTVTQDDWSRLLHRLETAPMIPHTKNILWTMLANVRAGIGIDEAGFLRVVELITRRANFEGLEYLHFGTVIMTKTSHPDAALRYYLAAAERLPPSSVEIIRLSNELNRQGRVEWVSAIEKANLAGNDGP